MINQGNIWGQLKDKVNQGVWDFVDSGVPVDGTSGTGVGLGGPGTVYTDASTGTRYINIGTAASPLWRRQNLIEMVTGTISAADIVATGAGKLGHANGYPLVPAPAAGYAVFLAQAYISYKYATAAYGGGGNVTINWGAGGAAITGLVNAAGSFGASVDKPLVFVPLSTVAIPLVPAASLNLVAASAFTQPGTAAGVIYYKVTYQTHNMNAQF